jgi:hypothetical protein
VLQLGDQELDRVRQAGGGKDLLVDVLENLWREQVLGQPFAQNPKEKVRFDGIFGKAGIVYLFPLFVII